MASKTHIFDGDKYHVYFEEEKQSVITPAVKYSAEDSKYIKAKDRYNKDINGNKTILLRVDQAHMGIAQRSLFPQDIAASFLQDYSKWDITGEEKYLNYDVYKVEGTLESYLSEKLGGNRFKMLVEKNTGILLKYEVFGEDNILNTTLETTLFKLNADIDDKDFVKENAAEYTAKKMPEPSAKNNYR
ncbi:hypothetical protein OXPF_05330 [Oxobacter pfennigii]|uniref:Uncharacterized protein n=1 Tax=Oxobacter pfennigii TaxID=36849 RepID=A0A0P8WE99_9CLOT|nr:hypothetical protein [Oxobacter pfennigii]KPU46052.1 hypothetical protein OXPF_05330 [Oxobacter pfennigii]